ncbi:MAG TPA: secretin N-terminal domain-containing protein [Steroidobacteraceae bacterium]|jgi:general secretion pathway protein D
MNKTALLILSAACALGPWGATAAQTGALAEDSRPVDTGVPIERLTGIIAKKTGKRFVLDPHVHGGISLIGVEPGEISYPEFLAILNAYGYAAVEDGKLVRIVPDANLRQFPTPIITPKDTRLPYEYVTQVIAVKYISAAQLIPILRPMIPIYGHLAAYPESNMLIISDYYANLRRIEAIIRDLDNPETAKSRTNVSKATPAESGAAH